MFESIPQLNVQAIRFPSDALDLGTLRRVHPEKFDIDVLRDGSVLQPEFFSILGKAPNAEVQLGGMLNAERSIAALAYCESLGIDEPDLGLSPEETRQQLTAYYMEYGIALGERHAAELISYIERQVRRLYAAKGR